MRVMKPFLLVLFASASCAKDPAPGAPETKAQAGPVAQADLSKLADEPEACKDCHPDIYAEWRQTTHARAHHTLDPVYAAVRALRVDKEGEAVTRVCGQCHHPRSAVLADTPAAHTGVSCATCHNAQQVLDRPGRMGAQRLRWARPGLFLGPHDLDDKKVDAHKVGRAPPHMKDGAQLCLACHDRLANAKGVAACTTGVEWAGVETKETCVSCHMPMAQGPGTVDTDRTQHRSHRFVGPRAGWNDGDWAPDTRGVKVEAALDRNRLKVTLTARGGHGYPTGFPGRMLIVKAVGRDATGAAVWTNFEANPMAESPESVLNKVYVDDKGTPTLPPYASRLARDTRLAPNEERALTFKVPRTVKKVEVQLLLRLLPPPLAKRLKLEGSLVDGVRPIAFATAAR